MGKTQWEVLIFFFFFANDHLCDHHFTTPKAAHGLILGSARKKKVCCQAASDPLNNLQEIHPSLLRQLRIKLKYFDKSSDPAANPIPVVLAYKLTQVGS